MSNGKVKDNGASVRSGSAGASRRKGNLPETTFINVQLTEAQKSAWAKWSGGGFDIGEALEGVLVSDYKVGFAYDGRNGAFICSITDRREESKFFAHSYSLRARNPLDALSRVIWLHSVFAEGDWENLAAPGDNSDIW